MKNNNKTTDPVQAVEQMIFERLDILKNGETKEQKRKARSEIIKLEKHLRNVSDKLVNGKVYPEQLYHSDDKPMNKKAVLKLIDSVETDNSDPRIFKTENLPYDKIDLSGVSVGKNRFEFVELD